MSAPEVTVIQDIRPLIAFVAPLLGVIGIVWAGEKRKNLRETFTFLVASIQATVVLSMVPLLLSGTIVEFHVWLEIVHFLTKNTLVFCLRVSGPKYGFSLLSRLLSMSK